jgi:hypothetical protein
MVCWCALLKQLSWSWKPCDRPRWQHGLRPLACWDCGFESYGRHGCQSPVNVVCCQVEVCASGWSLIQSSPTECDVSECDLKASIRRMSWPTGGFCAMGEIKTLLQFDIIRQALFGLVISKINSRRISDLPQSILVPDRVSQNPQWPSSLLVPLP